MITDPETVPDLNWMWGLQSSVHADEFPVRRWRIAASDWQYIQQGGHHYATGWSYDPPIGPTLFGYPVEVVPDAPGRFPELVLVCDRRN